MAYSVQRVAGMTYEQSPRDVVFLKSAGEAWINAKEVFDALAKEHQYEMKNKFEYWQRGGHQNKYFHGFDDHPYRQNFVFKRKQAGTYYRYYGFLTHPRPITDKRYQLCVLVSHEQKNQEGTDYSILDAINRISGTLQVIAAIKKDFPERIGGSDGALDRRK